jgi:hypothetical protein
VTEAPIADSAASLAKVNDQPLVFRVQLQVVFWYQTEPPEPIRDCAPQQCALRGARAPLTSLLVPADWPLLPHEPVSCRISARSSVTGSPGSRDQPRPNPSHFMDCPVVTRRDGHPASGTSLALAISVSPGTDW